MHRSNTVYEQKESKTVLNKYVGKFWWGKTGDGLFHWKKRYYGLWTGILARSSSLKLKKLWLIYHKHSFSLHKMLTDGLERCGLLWCFYQLFGLSFWRHPFTAEDPLVCKWCNATFLHIWSDDKQTHLHLGWPEGEHAFFFRGTIL